MRLSAFKTRCAQVGLSAAFRCKIPLEFYTHFLAFPKYAKNKLYAVAAHVGKNKGVGFSNALCVNLG